MRSEAQEYQRSGARESLRAYIDLTRAHFSLCWPLLFCSGLLLAFENDGGFSWSLTIRAALIGFLGLEAGMVQNDYVDREIDKKDVDFDKLTSYWRPFKTRPIPSGLIAPQKALQLFVFLVTICLLVIVTLPYPNSIYLLLIMTISYCLQYLYQVKKRSQKLPIAQLVGRVDVSLFPVAGYLCYGRPDKTALLIFLFFYPWVLAHLGVNDLVDIDNDRARGLKTVTVLYGVTGTTRWIVFFSVIHILIAPLFLLELGWIAVVGFLIGFLILGTANYVIVKGKSPAAGLKALPLFHLTMAVYVGSIILGYVF